MPCNPTARRSGMPSVPSQTFFPGVRHRISGEHEQRRMCGRGQRRRANHSGASRLTWWSVADKVLASLDGSEEGDGKGAKQRC